MRLVASKYRLASSRRTGTFEELYYKIFVGSLITPVKSPVASLLVSILILKIWVMIFDEVVYLAHSHHQAVSHS